MTSRIQALLVFMQELFEHLRVRLSGINNTAELSYIQIALLKI